LEDDVVLVAQVGISGSSVVKEKAILAGQVGVAGHLTIGAQSVVGAQGGVTKDIPPGTYVWGTPATDFKKYSKNLSNINRLDKLIARVKALEEKQADNA
jgi:UDP-3-O-[3-hydroxymyristoyl] glucosamine N-acyltransferase